jgi:hypothetical protein
VRFKPCANVDNTAGFGTVLGAEVVGQVMQIHEEHHWYRVQYQTPQGTRFETFKF